MNVKLISVTTPDVLLQDQGITTADDLIAYCARVSNPSNQLNTETAPRLLAYCLRNGHWSVFETAHMTLEIKTSRAIAAQILRHRSFTFQEFSQRYAVATNLERIELRKQDTKNRQGSGEPLNPLHHMYMIANMNMQSTLKLYDSMIEEGISKETARMILPLCTQTTMYMTGSVRSWIHYFDQRCADGTQKEHCDVAHAARAIFNEQFPLIAKALEDKQ